MERRVVVDGDPVSGTDRHAVSGTGPVPSTPPTTGPYAGTGTFTYTGSMTDDLSPFVTIDGHAVALVTSHSSLDPAETDPGGGHTGPAGRGFVASATTTAPTPTPTTLAITDTPLGRGTPSTGAGRPPLTIGGAAVLLHGDGIDTCGGTGEVSATTQSLVTFSDGG